MVDPERNECFICAQIKPKYWSIAGCGHRVCSLCSLRLRSLYQNKACPMCKVEYPMVYLTSNPGRFELSKFENISKNFADYQLGMIFEDKICRDLVLTPLKVTCPIDKCHANLQNKSDLRRHINSVHNRLLCDICLSHKKVFSCEFETFEHKAALLAHQKNSSGHPMCKICKSCFYSEDELITHSREKHESCHICQNRKRRLLNQQDNRYITPAIFDQDHYFADYDSLEEHFKQDHFICTDSVCLESKFIVFENEIELKAHLAEVHLDKKLQRSKQRQLQKINISFSRPSTSSNSPTKERVNQKNVSNEVKEAQKQEPAPKDNSNFFFPLSNVTQVQTWELFEARSLELSSMIEKSRLSLDEIRDYCRQFQQNQINSRQLIANLYRLLGSDNFQKIIPKLLELEEDSLKKVELNHAFKDQIDKILAFPSLPTQQAPPPSSSSYYSTLITGKKQNIPVIKGRILPKKTAHHSAPTDPSKYPLSLLPGVSFSQTKFSTTPRHNRDFSQVVGGAPSQTAAAKDIKPRDPQDFPSLNQKTTKPEPNAELDEDLFVIGAPAPQQTAFSSTDASTTTKKKKWKTVRHIGL
jgi:hypothetical protein